EQLRPLGGVGKLLVAPQRALGRGHGLLAGQLGEAIVSIEVGTYRVDDHAVVLLGPRGEGTERGRVETTGGLPRSGDTRTTLPGPDPRSHANLEARPPSTEPSGKGRR